WFISWVEGVEQEMRDKMLTGYADRRPPASPGDRTTMSEVDNTESWREVLDDLELLRAASRAMGGEERLHKHHNAGKLDARARIAHVLDPGTFMEIGTMVGGADAPADAVIIGSGPIDGRPGMVAGEDF